MRAHPTTLPPLAAAFLLLAACTDPANIATGGTGGVAGNTGSSSAGGHGGNPSTTSSTGGGASSTGSGGGLTTSSSASGTGGGPVCTPDATMDCYSGPSGTAGIGACRAGKQTCNTTGTAWGPCTGEITPKAEDCSTPEDDACSGIIAPCGASTKWSKRFGDGANQAAGAVALDDAANVIVAGNFPGKADFGGGSLTSSGPNDIFVAKLAPSGAHVWSKHIAADSVYTRVAADGLGNVVLAASVAGLVDFGGGPLPGQAQLHDVVLAKLDKDGNHLWAKRWISAGADAFPTALKVAPNGDIFLVARYRTSLDVGCGAVSPPSGYTFGVLVAKLGSDGSCGWSKSLGGEQLFANALGINASGEVYVAGSFSGLADLGGGPEGSNANDPSYVFLTRLAADGTYLLSKKYQAGAPALATAMGLVIDPAGNVFLTGSIGPAGGNPPPGMINFGNGQITTPSTSGAYVAKLDPMGNGIWSKAFGPGASVGLDIALDPSGNVVATGLINGSVDFGTGPLSVNPGVYLARFSGASGATTSASAFLGAASPQLAVDGLANAILAGGFTPNVDLGTGTLVSAGASDGFIADLGH